MKKWMATFVVALFAVTSIAPAMAGTNTLTLTNGGLFVGWHILVGDPDASLAYMELRATTPVRIGGDGMVFTIRTPEEVTNPITEIKLLSSDNTVIAGPGTAKIVAKGLQRIVFPTTMTLPIGSSKYTLKGLVPEDCLSGDAIIQVRATSASFSPITDLRNGEIIEGDTNAVLFQAVRVQAPVLRVSFHTRHDTMAGVMPEMIATIGLSTYNSSSEDVIIRSIPLAITNAGNTFPRNMRLYNPRTKIFMSSGENILNPSTNGIYDFVLDTPFLLSRHSEWEYVEIWGTHPAQFGERYTIAVTNPQGEGLQRGVSSKTGRIVPPTMVGAVQPRVLYVIEPGRYGTVSTRSIERKHVQGKPNTFIFRGRGTPYAQYQPETSLTLERWDPFPQFITANNLGEWECEVSLEAEHAFFRAKTIDEFSFQLAWNPALPVQHGIKEPQFLGELRAEPYLEDMLLKSIAFKVTGKADVLKSIIIWSGSSKIAEGALSSEGEIVQLTLPSPFHFRKSIDKYLRIEGTIGIEANVGDEFTLSLYADQSASHATNTSATGMVSGRTIIPHSYAVETKVKVK